MGGRRLRDRLRLCGRHLQRAGTWSGEVWRGVQGELRLQHPPGALLQAHQETKKLCTSFTDADLCIGNVATHQIKRIIEPSAGEKRMSAHPDHEYLRYK